MLSKICCRKAVVTVKNNFNDQLNRVSLRNFQNTPILAKRKSPYIIKGMLNCFDDTIEIVLHREGYVVIYFYFVTNFWDFEYTSIEHNVSLKKFLKIYNNDTFDIEEIL